MAGLYSDQITVTTAGTAVQGPDVKGKEFWIKAHADNTDTVWVGNDDLDDVSATTGFPLNAGEAVYVVLLGGNLNELWFDADVSGEKICWFRVVPG